MIKKLVNNCAFFHKMMQAVRCPSDEMSLTNCVFTSEKEQQFEQWVELHNLVKDVNIILNFSVETKHSLSSFSLLSPHTGT